MVMSELTGDVSMGVLCISNVLEMGSIVSPTNKEIKGSGADAARERLGGMQPEVRKFCCPGNATTRRVLPR